MNGIVNESGVVSLPANVALEPFRRVVVGSDSQLRYAGADEVAIGTLNARHIISGLGAADYAAVISRSAPGTRRMVGNGAIAAYSRVYGASDGKVQATPNGNPIGVALSAISNDGEYLEVDEDRYAAALTNTVPGPSFFDDFIGDYPAAGTAMPAPWTKVETDGLGVTSADQANGVLVFAFDAVAEVAVAAMHMANAPFDVDQEPVFEARVAVYDIGDHAALDINIGLASDTHATDFDSVTAYAAFHLDGSALDLKCRSKASNGTVADTDTTIDLVDDTFVVLRIDCTDKSNVKFYVNGARVLSGTTFSIAGYTGTLSPIVHVEKTSNDTTADVRVDWIRVSSERA